jgi:hypothetical protein
MARPEGEEAAGSVTVRLPAPDPHFRLTLEDRARLKPGFDLDALERLLANVAPEWRDDLLAPFLIPPPHLQKITVLVKILDPALQLLLDEVWAPMWDQWPADAIDTETKDYPGRELARQRRREREAVEFE